MARGDPWRIMGGLYIPNPRFLIDSDFTSSGQWLPDAWTSVDGGAGGVTYRYGDGFSGYRSMRIISTPQGGGYNDLRSDAGPRGALPVYNSNSMYIRLVFWYLKSTVTQTLTPSLIIYSSDEANSTTLTFAAISDQAASWTKYDNVINADLSVSTLGWVPSHVKLNFRIGGSNLVCQFGIADITCGYNPMNPRDSAGYAVLSLPPMPGGLTIESIDLGQLSRTSKGQSRYVDSSGGAQVSKVTAHFGIASENDRRIIDAAYRINRGHGETPAASLFLIAYPPPNPQPIAVELFMFDGATQSAGKQIENAYFDFTNPPRFEPIGFLGNGWLSPISLEEVG